MKHINLISSALVLTLVLLFANSASAQYSIPRPPRPQTQVCQGVPQVSIRNLPYNDYSRYTSLSSSTVAAGGYFQISTRCMPFDGQIVVTLQDANRPPNSSGVTALRLTNISRSGNVVTVQAPTHSIYKNRTYYVGLFVYGQPWKTANPGSIKIN